MGIPPDSRDTAAVAAPACAAAHRLSGPAGRGELAASSPSPARNRPGGAARAVRWCRNSIVADPRHLTTWLRTATMLTPLSHSVSVLKERLIRNYSLWLAPRVVEPSITTAQIAMARSRRRFAVAWGRPQRSHRWLQRRLKSSNDSSRSRQPVSAALPMRRTIRGLSTIGPATSRSAQP